jgi:hypothetical protein
MTTMPAECSLSLEGVTGLSQGCTAKDVQLAKSSFRVHPPKVLSGDPTESHGDGLVYQAGAS